MTRVQNISWFDYQNRFFIYFFDFDCLRQQERDEENYLEDPNTELAFNCQEADVIGFKESVSPGLLQANVMEINEI
jgi:hypothetical protein